jgi:RimJ/RimL family protein N-acetyltransferase
VPWLLTDDVEAFADRAWPLLAARPVEQTVALTVIQALRAGHHWSDVPPVLAWYEDGGVRGAVSMTPPFELLLAAVPEEAVAELARTLREHQVALPGVNGQVATVERFVDAWLDETDLRAWTAFEQRLYALGELRAPDPPPPGRARLGHEGDAEERLWLWEDEGGAVVSLAARTAPAVGVGRVAPVYTPPEQRRRGYGAAITAAVTADALDRGADHVVLFTDLANPTSNAIYQRIGFAPVSDRRVVRFADA